MITANTYNGWTNYETWLVKLWIDNAEGSQNYWQDRTREIYESALPDKTFSQVERAALTLMDELKDSHEAVIYGEVLPERFKASFVADLLSSAFSEVDWREIAMSLIEDNCEVEA